MLREKAGRFSKKVKEEIMSYFPQKEEEKPAPKKTTKKTRKSSGKKAKA